ncbi:MAG TPA: hypothetical protein ENN07_06555 [candidate division Zixibacteria bacterium]|nr:hypothetical protein [candidate division Zixibacteria bacterium]
MILVWNILLALAILVLWPLAIIFAILGKHRLLCRLGFVPKSYGKSVWIHSASVGEAGVSASIRDMLKEIDPTVNVFMTATTKMGLRRLKAISAPNDRFCAFPLDFYPFTALAYNRNKPDLLIVVETEFWPNLLTIAKKRGIPAILVNGRISQKTVFWAKRFPRTFRKISDCFSAFMMKSEDDANNLISAGVPPERIQTLGNLKFAGIPANIEPIANFGRPTVVFGSARPDEFEAIAEACISIKSEFPEALFIFAPRHLNTAPQARLSLEKHGLSVVRRTTNTSPENADVYLIDTIGELLGFYASCDVAFVGGTLADYGGHNPLEPAFFAKPVVFGPFSSSNREAYELLLDGGGAIEVNDAESLSIAICGLLRDSQTREEMGITAKKLLDGMGEVALAYRRAIEEWVSR